MSWRRPFGRVSRRPYAGADPEATWAALEAMVALFRDVATGVAERFGFAYPQRDDERVTAHLRRVRLTSVDADARVPRRRTD